MASQTKTYKVGIICGSTRQPRAGPQITTFIHQVLCQHLASQPSAPQITLTTIDISDFNLPLFDEPGIPQAITSPSDYTHEHTRVWSQYISSFDAFVFVTPQYNWGIPAALKNAIDFLFNEWTGKPGMVVSYGGHGGGRAAEALRTVLLGLKMKTPEKTVNLAFPDREFRDKCFKGEKLLLDVKEVQVWKKDQDDVIAVWEDMVRLWSN